MILIQIAILAKLGGVRQPTLYCRHSLGRRHCGKEPCHVPGGEGGQCHRNADLNPRTRAAARPDRLLTFGCRWLVRHFVIPIGSALQTPEAHGVSATQLLPIVVEPHYGRQDARRSCRRQPDLMTYGS